MTLLLHIAASESKLLFKSLKADIYGCDITVSLTCCLALDITSLHFFGSFFLRKKATCFGGSGDLQTLQYRCIFLKACSYPGHYFLLIVQLTFAFAYM